MTKYFLPKNLCYQYLLKVIVNQKILFISFIVASVTLFILVIKKRIYKHLYDIITFIPFNDGITSVSIHFNLKYHDYKHHFSFFVLKKDIVNLEERLNREPFLINLCKKLGVKLMNDHIPIIKEYFFSSRLLT